MYSKIWEALLRKSGAQNVPPAAGTGYKLKFLIPSGAGSIEPAPQAVLTGAGVRTTTLRTRVDRSGLVTTAGGRVWSAQGFRGSQLPGEESRRGTDVLSHRPAKNPHHPEQMQATEILSYRRPAVTNSPVRTHSANPEPWKLRVRGRAYLLDLSGPQHPTLKNVKVCREKSAWRSRAEVSNSAA